AEYSYNEFFLDLPEHWRQYLTSEDNTLNWHSDVENASITVSADFYEVPDEKAAMKFAEVCLSGRHNAMESLARVKSLCSIAASSHTLVVATGMLTATSS